MKKERKERVRPDEEKDHSSYERIFGETANRSEGSFSDDAL